MSSETSAEEEKVEVVLDVQSIESSEDPPRDEWSSLILAKPQKGRKQVLYEEELYDPGSGEICLKYLPLSDSSVFRHPYYAYPAVLDPGIQKALLAPPDKVIYADDGQELYMALCKEMEICPVKMFHRSLLEPSIDMKYYCVDPKGVRAMCVALMLNRIVKSLNFKDNFLSKDACFHLGDLLTLNSTITELNLEGCRIGPVGAKQLFAGLVVNRALRILNLNRNDLGDEGGEYFATAVFNGIDIQQIYLSYNNLGNATASALALAFETHNTLTHIDLSWNNLFAPLGTCNMLNMLEENTVLEELNLSWNSLTGPRIGNAIKNATKAPQLRVLNLSNNIFSGEAISNIIGNLTKAKNLKTLDLSYNPMDPKAALMILNKLKMRSVKIQNLLLDNVFVDGEFLLTLEKLKGMKFRANAVITYGGITGKYIPKGPDPRETVLNRVDFLAMKKPKKNKVDVALIFLQLEKNKYEMMDSKDFSQAIKSGGANVDENCIDEIVNVFPGPRTKKSKMINIKLLADYVRRKWPDRQLPPTPPPEPEPEPLPSPIGKEKGKDKGKGKGKK